MVFVEQGVDVGLEELAGLDQDVADRRGAAHDLARARVADVVDQLLAGRLGDREQDLLRIVGRAVLGAAAGGAVGEDLGDRLAGGVVERGGVEGVDELGVWSRVGWSLALPPVMTVRTVVVEASAKEAEEASRTEFVTSKLSLASLSQPGRSDPASLAEVSVAVPACCLPLGAAAPAPAVARVEKYSILVRLPWASWP